MDWLNRLPFRLGTTSYILPDDILPNVQYLAGKVLDIELVLFEVDEAQNNLPTKETLTSMIELGSRYNLTYTVHLPLDLGFGSGDDKVHISVSKALHTIQATRSLSPYAYIAHLDGRELQLSATPQALKHWKDGAMRLLSILAEAAGDFTLLSIENLEHYPQGFWQQALDGLPASRCVDIGHLWLEGIDPLPYLQWAMPLTTVIHLHGNDQRDHASLEQVEKARLDSILHYLVQNGFRGVVTIEVFSQEDFLSSCKSVESSLKRIGFC